MTRHPHSTRSSAPRFRGAAARSADGMSTQEFVQYINGRTGNTNRVSNPYASVSTVYACVKAKAAALTQLELRVSDNSDQVIEDGPLVQLLARPNRNQSRREFLKALSSWLDIFGEVYLIKRISGNTIDAMYVVSPIEMTEIEVGGEVTAYQYSPINGAPSETFLPEEIHVIRDPDYGSGDLRRAMGVKQSAALAISQHYQSDVANDESLRRGAGGGLGLRTEGNLSDPQRDELRRNLEDRHSGANNRHKWLLLEGAMSVEKLYATFSEMEFVDLKYYSREDICVAFGLNPLVLGYGGREGLGSGQHTEAAHEIVWNDTHLPRAAWIAEELCEAVVPHIQGDRSLSMRDARRRALRQTETYQRMFLVARDHRLAIGLAYTIWFDASGVSVLQKASLELAKQAAEWIDKGVPLNQVLAAYDLPFEDVAWGNTWWKPFGLVDVQSQESADPFADDDPVSAPTEPQNDPEPEDEPRSVYLKLMSETMRDKLQQQWELSWAGLATELTKRRDTHVYQLRKITLANFKRLWPKTNNAPSIAMLRDLIGEILFSLVEANSTWTVKALPLIRASYELGGKQSMTEAAAAEGKAPDDAGQFNIDNSRTVERMRQRMIRIKEPDRTLRRELAETMAEGIANSESLAQIEERLRKGFNLGQSRSKTIARTEIAGAVEDARHEGRVQANVPSKSWLGSRSETSRPWHMEMEKISFANPIPNEQNFTLPQTGAQTPYPRGSGLTAEDAANCRCTCISRYPQDTIKDAAVLAHLVSRGFVTDAQLPSGGERGAA